MKRTLAIGAAALGLAALPLPASANPQIEAVMQKYRQASEQIKGTIAASKDEASAKANAPALEAAVKRQQAAQEELQQLMPRLDPKRDAEAFQKAAEEVQKTNQEVGDAKAAALQNKATGAPLRKAIVGN